MTFQVLDAKARVVEGQLRLIVGEPRGEGNTV